MITHLLAGVDRAMTASSADDPMSSVSNNNNNPLHRRLVGNSVSEISDPELRLLLIDLTRLLHCMEQHEGLPPNQSWQSLLFRAQLAQDLWKRISSSCSTNPMTDRSTTTMDPVMYRELAHQVDHCCRRAHALASQLQRQEEEEDGDGNGGSKNLVERIFFQRPRDDAETETVEEEGDFDYSEFDDEGEQSSRPDDVDDIGDDNVEQNNRRHPNRDSTTKQHQTHGGGGHDDVQELQQAQREQMEAAISAMVSQMKAATQNIHSQINQQTTQVLDEMETVAEQNVQDVSKVVQDVKEHHQNRWRSNLGTWTLFFTIVGVFVFCLMVIFTVPKRKDACIFFCDDSYSGGRKRRKNKGSSRNRYHQQDDEDEEEIGGLGGGGKWDGVFEESEEERQEKERLADLLHNMKTGGAGPAQQTEDLDEHYDDQPASASLDYGVEDGYDYDDGDRVDGGDSINQNFETDEAGHGDGVAQESSMGEGGRVMDHGVQSEAIISEDEDQHIYHEEHAQVDGEGKINDGSDSVADIGEDQTEHETDIMDREDGIMEGDKDLNTDQQEAPLEPVDQDDLKNRWDSRPDEETVDDYKRYEGHGKQKRDDLLNAINEQDAREAAIAAAAAAAAKGPNEFRDALLESNQHQQMLHDRQYDQGGDDRSNRGQPGIMKVATEGAGFARGQTAKKYFAPKDLRTAATNGDLGLLRSYVAQKPEYIHRTDKNGWGPLHVAIRHSQSHIVEYLVESGADYNSQTKEGLLPLGIALDELGESHPITIFLRTLGAFKSSKEQQLLQDDAAVNSNNEVYNSYVEQGRSKLDKFFGGSEDDDDDDGRYGDEF